MVNTTVVGCARTNLSCFAVGPTAENLIVLQELFSHGGLGWLIILSATSQIVSSAVTWHYSVFFPDRECPVLWVLPFFKPFFCSVFFCLFFFPFIPVSPQTLFLKKECHCSFFNDFFELQSLTPIVLFTFPKWIKIKLFEQLCLSCVLLVGPNNPGYTTWTIKTFYEVWFQKERLDCSWWAKCDHWASVYKFPNCWINTVQLLYVYYVIKLHITQYSTFHSKCRF